MPIEIIEHNGNMYPKFQAEGFAAQFAFSFAKKLLHGEIYDIGCNREEWAFVDDSGKRAIMIDPAIDPEFSAMNLPVGKVDGIFSSHMLEHYEGRFQDVIEYWITKIKDGGVIFLYLPNCEHQTYWAWDNKKHIHYLSPTIMSEYCEHLAKKELITWCFVSAGYDLNSSFYCVIEK